MFFDIEILSDEFPDVVKADKPVSCITTYISDRKEYKTFWLGDYKNDKLMLEDFINHVKTEAPDMLLAWNVDFDYTYLHQRYMGIAKKLSPINLARMGKKYLNHLDIFYPAGISILDYLTLFRKVNMREASYALDYIGEKYLGRGKKFKNPHFGSLNEEVKLRNIGDVEMLVDIEALKKGGRLISYYDEVRRLSKVKWEDLYFNSRIVEMMLLEEAKNQNIILPNKTKAENRLSFKGATRESSEIGAVFDVGKFDLTSAYPSMIVNFCLDTQNIGQDGIEISGTKFKQNKEALLPKVVQKILTIKNDLKKAVKKDSSLQKKYDAIKAIVNSTFGVMGNQYFRLHDNNVASAITYLVRDLILYTKERLEGEGYKVLYWDTDSVFINTKEDISSKLNSYIQDWGKKYNKDEIDLAFEYEGYFEKLFLLGKCHYYGYIHGKDEPEIKGVEIKRSSSSKYEAQFQRELLEKVLNKESRETIFKWIEEEKKKIKTLPLLDLAFPCKVQNKNYVNKPIFVRAFFNSKEIFKDFDVRQGELFWYIFVKKLGKDKNGKDINVLGINKENTIEKDKVDWEEVIRRSIILKAENIFDAMEWDKLRLYNSDQLSLF
jgi:DNA polymerase elongation subunit (family B)